MRDRSGDRQRAGEDGAHEAGVRGDDAREALGFMECSEPEADAARCGFQEDRFHGDGAHEDLAHEDLTHEDLAQAGFTQEPRSQEPPPQRDGSPATDAASPPMRGHAAWRDGDWRDGDWRDAIFQRAPDPIVVADLNGDVLQVNGAAEAIFGDKLESLATLRIDALWRGPPVSAANRAGALFERGPLGDGGQPCLLLRPGETTPALRYETPIADASGRPCALAHSFRPQRFARPDRVETTAPPATVRRLEESERAWRDFALIAAHDLREPLNKILLFAEHIEELSSDPDVRVSVGGIRRTGDNVRRLIASLMEYSRVSYQEIKRVDAPLRDPIMAAVDLLSADIARLNAEVRVVQEPPGEPMRARIDTDLLTRVFQNLISNALKAVRDRKPVIVITVWRTRAMAHISVSDNGVGVPSDHARRVFEPFFRLEGPGVDAPSGGGLGLSICRRIIESHGGQIWLRERNAGRATGATVDITFPA